MTEATKPVLGITLGDPSGIGPEIIVRALARPDIYEMAQPLVIGRTEILAETIERLKLSISVNGVASPEAGVYRLGVIDVLDLALPAAADWKLGEVSKTSGEISFRAVKTAIELAMDGKIDAVVTTPINKEAINLAGHRFAGHTEIFAHYTRTEEYCMMLAHGDFRVGHVSTHVSLREACDLATEERVARVIELMNEALVGLGIEKPRLAVAGLNPHAGEGGLFGREEIEEIIPAIRTARAAGIDAQGPFPPDTLFPKLKGKFFDAAVCMYHDQGHIPTKLLGFQYEISTGKWSSVEGVNITLGLPIIRVSVDHGTAFDIAGKGIANEASLVDAITYAARLSALKTSGS